MAQCTAIQLRLSLLKPQSPQLPHPRKQTQREPSLASFLSLRRVAGDGNFPALLAVGEDFRCRDRLLDSVLLVV